MNEPISPEELEALVRAHLDRSAEGIDPGPRLARIQETLRTQADIPAPAIRGSRGRWGNRWLWGAVAAAAVGFAFVGGLQLRPARASPQALVREAQQAHLQPVDRCYLVEVRHESGWPGDEVPATPPIQVSRVWTRGDRFWVEWVHPGKRWAWGRDEEGGVWMTWGPRRAVRLDADEVPGWMSLLCTVHTMQPETLLDEVLSGFDLVREGQGAATLPTTYVIRATRKAGYRHPWLRSAILEVDAETKVLRRVVLSRVRRGLPLATTTYTLVESEVQPDANYRPEGHLREPFAVYTPEDHPERRLAILGRIYGPGAWRWFPGLKRTTPARTPGK